jgi:DNA replication licensing factor MCM7
VVDTRRRAPSDDVGDANRCIASHACRFDLLFVLLDKPDADMDMRLAQHITHVHKHGRHPATEYELLDTNFIRTYIAQARRLEPYIPAELSEFIVASYVGMRQAEDSSPQTYTYTTARSLLGILRLSQALARLSLRDVVSQQDVEEAMRLMDQSKASLREEREHSNQYVGPSTLTQRCWESLVPLKRSRY